MTKTIRKLPTVDDRVETGPVQFGDDWPGVFIRGDNAFGYAMALDAVLNGHDDPIAKVMVEGLIGLLRSSNTSTLFTDIDGVDPEDFQATMNANIIRDKRQK